MREHNSACAKAVQWLVGQEMRAPSLMATVLTGETLRPCLACGEQVPLKSGEIILLTEKKASDQAWCTKEISRRK